MPSACVPPVDVRQKLLGLGAANLLGALAGGYPVAGGLSQSAVNDKAGAKSPLAMGASMVAIGAALIGVTMAMGG